jgi:hypothetical protein
MKIWKPVKAALDFVFSVLALLFGLWIGGFFD